MAVDSEIITSVNLSILFLERVYSWDWSQAHNISPALGIWVLFF